AAIWRRGGRRLVGQRRLNWCDFRCSCGSTLLAIEFGVELLEPPPALLEPLARQLVVAEEHVLKGDHRAVEYFFEQRPRAGFAEILPAGFALCEADDVVAVELHEQVAVVIDDRLREVTRLIEPLGLGQE